MPRAKKPAQPTPPSTEEYVTIAEQDVPVPVVDSLQDIFEAVGSEVQREMGRALHSRLTPFARVSDEGLELLVPAALVGARPRRCSCSAAQVMASAALDAACAGDSAAIPSAQWRSRCARATPPRSVSFTT